MPIIKLTKGYEAIVDDRDLELVKAIGSWYALVTSKTVYAQRTLPRPRRGALLLHRFILSAPPGIDVDHIDGNGLNCQRDNLRFATKSQNRANSILVKNATGSPGVYVLRSGRFQAQIKIHGKTICLGSYDTIEEASNKYEDARHELFGEFTPIKRRALTWLAPGKLPA